MRRILNSWLIVLLLAIPSLGQADEYWHPKNFGTRARKSIMKDLYNNPVSGANSFQGKDHVHVLYKGWLHKPNDRGEGRGVFVKEHIPELVFGNTGDFDNPVGAAVAHTLDVMLRGAYVPPAAIRRWVAVDGRTTDYSSVILEAGNAKSSWGRDMGKVRPHHLELAASDIGIRGALLGNKDVMHNPNILEADHWVDGTRSVVAIDWAGLFKADQRLEDGAAIRRKPVRRFNLATYQAMKKLSYGALAAELRDSTIPGGYLADWQLNRILKTRDELIAHIDEQVSRRSAEDVFFRHENGQWNVGPYGWLD